jgi:cell division septation protein DedD
MLLVAPDTGDAVVRTAIGLAEARAAGGHETVLVDAGFDNPRLHQFLDVPNLEGLADVFEFGASLGRVMTRPDTRRFDFVPAGAYVPEPEAILRSPRWDHLADDLAPSTLMLVFVPWDSPGLEALSRRAGAAILLGDARGVDRSADALDPACEVVAVVEPALAMAPDRLAAEAGERHTVDAATIFDDPELTEPVVFRSDRRRRRLLPILLGILLVAAILAAAYYGYTTLYAAPEPPPEPAPVSTQQTPAPEPQPVETPIGFSVAVEAHQDLEAARERLARLRRAEPGIRFYLAPVSVNGSLFYRVLAGPVPDRDAGMALMRLLVDAGHKTAFDSWAVRPTTFAFHLGEYDSPAAAEARVSELAGLGVPAYVVPVRYEPGEPRHRVYGGAFENRAAASVMRELLTDAGIDAPLIERVGEPVEVGG